MQNCIILSVFGLILLTSGCAELGKKGDQNKGPAGANITQTTGNRSDSDNNSDENNPQDNDIANNNANPTAFEKEFAERFADFTALRPRVLEKVLEKIPSQETLWGCGLHQSETAIELAHINHNKNRSTTRDFKAVDTYPLAIDVNLNHPAMQEVAGIGQLPLDDEGNFRVGALPHDLAGYIDNNFPKGYPVKAEAVSQEALSPKDLVAIINNNLKLGLSTPTFYVISPESLLIHVYSIVGFKGDELLILDTTGEGIDRFSIRKTADFLAGMNASAKIQEIKGYITLGEIFNLRALIKQAGGRAAKPETFNQWKAFSVIKFHKA